MNNKTLKKTFYALTLASVLSTSLPYPNLCAPTVVEAAIKNGWHGQKYYRNGIALTGVHKLGDNRYYFTPKGNLATGFRTYEGKTYYFATKGKLGSTLGRAITGLKKIDKHWYYFNANGVQLTKTKTIGDTKYFINNNGHVEAYKNSGKFYFPDGTPMTQFESQDFITFLSAREVVEAITTNKMTDEQKLRACFDWVMEKPYIMRRKFDFDSNWTSIYANDHFKRTGGDCHADGCAFAYLARAIGYKDVYACLDIGPKGTDGHCWAEIDGKVYDPLFAQAKSFSQNYNAPYGVYKLSAITRIAIMENFE